jgi:hypothetical protein
MNDHKGERRLPGFILTAKLLQRVVQRRQVCNRRLAEHKLATSPDSVSSEANLEPEALVYHSNAVLHPCCIRANGTGSIADDQGRRWASDRTNEATCVYGMKDGLWDLEAGPGITNAPPRANTEHRVRERWLGQHFIKMDKNRRARIGQANEVQIYP